MGVRSAKATHLLLLEACEVPAVVESHLLPLPVLHEGGGCRWGGERRSGAEKPPKRWAPRMRSLLHHLVREGHVCWAGDLGHSTPSAPLRPCRDRGGHFPISQAKKLRHRETKSWPVSEGPGRLVPEPVPVTVLPHPAWGPRVVGGVPGWRSQHAKPGSSATSSGAEGSPPPQGPL